MRMILVLMMLMGTPALALEPGEMFADTALEERARYIGRQLRCVKCRNQSIFDSNASIARDLRVVVRERITAGESDSEILDYVSARYGDYVLLKPPVAAHTYALWLAPFALVLAGGLALAASLRRVARRSAAQSAEDPSSPRVILEEKA